VGGSEDRFIGHADLWMTAAWYGTCPKILAGLPHAMMVDPEWRVAADAVMEWLNGKFPRGASAPEP
jgi:hypothetical protein